MGTERKTGTSDLSSLTQSQISESTILDLFSGLPGPNIDRRHQPILAQYYFIPLHSVIYCQPIFILCMVIAAIFGGGGGQSPFGQLEVHQSLQKDSEFLWNPKLHYYHVHIIPTLSPTAARGIQSAPPILLVPFVRSSRIKIQLNNLPTGPYCRSQCPGGLRRRSITARLLRSWVRIPPGAQIFVCCECRVLSGRGLCEVLITRPEESYRLWCVVVCDLETSRIRRPWPALGRSATKKDGSLLVLRVKITWRLIINWAKYIIQISIFEQVKLWSVVLWLMEPCSQGSSYESFGTTFCFLLQ